jgi:hypothetical protein
VVRSQSTFRIIRTAAIKEIEVVALPAAPTPSTGGKWADKRSAEDEEELPKIDIEVVAAREKRAVEKAEEEAKMWHEGVTGRAMLIFEALSKTMPCEWLPMGNTLGIVVLREVRCFTSPATAYLPHRHHRRHRSHCHSPCPPPPPGAHRFALRRGLVPGVPLASRHRRAAPRPEGARGRARQAQPVGGAARRAAGRRPAACFVLAERLYLARGRAPGLAPPTRAELFVRACVNKLYAVHRHSSGGSAR